MGGWLWQMANGKSAFEFRGSRLLFDLPDEEKNETGQSSCDRALNGALSFGPVMASNSRPAALHG